MKLEQAWLKKALSLKTYLLVLTVALAPSYNILIKWL